MNCYIRIISVNILLITVNTLPICFSAFSTMKLFLQNSFDKVKSFLQKIYFTKNYFYKKIFYRKLFYQKIILQKIILPKIYFTKIFLPKIYFTKKLFYRKILFLSHHTLHCHKFITIHYIILCWSTTTYSICTNIINEVFNI